MALPCDAPVANKISVARGEAEERRHLECLGDRAIGIREQAKGQVVFRLELHQTPLRIAADAENLDTPRAQSFKAVSQLAGMRGANRRAGAHVEIDEDRSAGIRFGEIDGYAVLIRGFECRCRLATGRPFFASWLGVGFSRSFPSLAAKQSFRRSWVHSEGLTFVTRRTLGGS